MIASLNAMIPSENNRQVVQGDDDEPAYSEKLKAPGRGGMTSPLVSAGGRGDGASFRRISARAADPHRSAPKRNAFPRR